MSILKFISELISLFNKIFDALKKSPTEKIEKQKESFDKIEEEFKKTGRPKWF